MWYGRRMAGTPTRTSVSRHGCRGPRPASSATKTSSRHTGTYYTTRLFMTNSRPRAWMQSINSDHAVLCLCDVFRDRLVYREQMARTSFTLATQTGPSNPFDKPIFLTLSKVLQHTIHDARHFQADRRRHGVAVRSPHVCVGVPDCYGCGGAAPEGHACTAQDLPHTRGGTGP